MLTPLTGDSIVQRIRRLSSAALALCCGLLAACATTTSTNDTQRSAAKAAPATNAIFDVIVRHGMVYDGSGARRAARTSAFAAIA